MSNFLLLVRLRRLAPPIGEKRRMRPARGVTFCMPPADIFSLPTQRAYPDRRPDTGLLLQKCPPTRQKCNVTSIRCPEPHAPPITKKRQIRATIYVASRGMQPYVEDHKSDSRTARTTDHKTSPDPGDYL